MLIINLKFIDIYPIKYSNFFQLYKKLSLKKGNLALVQCARPELNDKIGIARNTYAAMSPGQDGVTDPQALFLYSLFQYHMALPQREEADPGNSHQTGQSSFLQIKRLALSLTQENDSKYITLKGTQTGAIVPFWTFSHLVKK